MWDFVVRVVYERECEDSSSYWRPSGFCEKIHEKLSREVSHVLSTWLECKESWQLGFRECLMGKAFSWNILFCYFVISTLPSLYPHYIYPHYLHIVRSAFQRENPSTHLRVRDCHTHNHLHISLWFSSIPTSPYPNPWEVDSPNIYHTQFECKVRFWCCWEAL